MSMYDKNHYNIVISLQLIKINEKKNLKVNSEKESISFWIFDGIIPIVPVWKLVNLFFSLQIVFKW